MLNMSGFCSLGQPALESSKRRRGTGRITVDAREKGLTDYMMHHALANLQGTELLTVDPLKNDVDWIWQKQGSGAILRASQSQAKLPKQKQPLP